MSRTCSTDECYSKTIARGLCSKHYMRLRQNSGNICSIGGCGRKHHSSGLCATHYRRKGKDLDKPICAQQSPVQTETCSFEECQRPSAHIGLCGIHYGRQWRGGRMDAPVKRSKRTPAPKCPIDGCDRSVRKGGLCGAHYCRKRSGKDMTPPIGSLKYKGPWSDTLEGPRPIVCSIPGCDRNPTRLRAGMCPMHDDRRKRGVDLYAPARKKRGTAAIFCTIDGCKKPVIARDLCSMHYSRLKTGLDMHRPFGHQKKSPIRCSVNGCSRDAKTVGICSTHYARKRSGIDLTIPIREAKRPFGRGKWLVTGGYVVCIVPKGTIGAKGQRSNQMLEHRYVMQKHLGRPLLPKETIHHRDGNRHNNTLNNLELKSGKHGAGINIIDGISASLGWIERYEPLDLEELAMLRRLQDKIKQGIISPMEPTKHNKKIAPTRSGN